MHKYVESKTTRIMMANVRHVTSISELREFQATRFLMNRVYSKSTVYVCLSVIATTPQKIQQLENLAAVIRSLWDILCQIKLKSVHGVSIPWNVGLKFTLSNIAQDVLRSKYLTVYYIYICIYIYIHIYIYTLTHTHIHIHIYARARARARARTHTHSLQ